MGGHEISRRQVTELSVGQQQRVAAARSLMGAPELVLADDYFRRRRASLVHEKDDLRMEFEAMHRPLEDYFSALERAGLLTEAVREPQQGNGGRWDRVPLFLDVLAVRA